MRKSMLFFGVLETIKNYFSELFTFPWEVSLVMTVFLFIISQHNFHADSLIVASYLFKNDTKDGWENELCIL